MMTALDKDLIGAHQVTMGMFQFIEMIDHQDAVEYRYTEESDESDTGRDAKGQTSHPQRQNASDERKGNG